jgi:hypothetical protein
MFVYELSGEAVVRDITPQQSIDEEALVALVAEAIGIDADRIAISPGQRFWDAGSLCANVKFTLLRPAKGHG